MEPTIKRASNANPIEDARLKIGEELEIPISDNLEGLDPGALALGITGFIGKLRDGSTIELGSGSGGGVDISGKVDKVVGKSLIADTEITRLATVVNQDISGKADLETRAVEAIMIDNGAGVFILSIAKIGRADTEAGPLGLGAVDFSSQDNDFVSGGALGKFSLAIGENTKASGEYSVATGYYSYATGNFSHVFGSYLAASGSASFASGNGSDATGSTSTAMCRSTIARAFASMAIGAYNDPILSAPETSSVLNPKSPLFMIGNGTSSKRSNAYWMLADATSFQSNIANYSKDFSGEIGREGLVTKGFTEWITPQLVASLFPDLQVGKQSVNHIIFELGGGKQDNSSWTISYGSEVITMVASNSTTAINGTNYYNGIADNLDPGYKETDMPLIVRQFRANIKLDRDFVIYKGAGVGEIIFHARKIGVGYDFPAVEAAYTLGTNISAGTETIMEEPVTVITETEKAQIVTALAPTYKMPYAKIFTPFTDKNLASGQEVSVPLTMTFHKEDAGDFTSALVFRDGFDLIELFPDTTIDDTIIGYASMGVGTTGGVGGTTVMVSTYAELKAAVETVAPIIVHVSGTITGTGLLYVTSNTTIIGLPGSQIIGVGLSMYAVNNVIIRYLAIHKVVTYSNIIIKEDAHHIWVDHCMLSSDIDHGWEYYDGLLDVTKRAEYVTISNCTLKDNNHALLIGGGNESVDDIGHLTVTIYNCWFINLNERQPAIRFGYAHVFNCYIIDSLGYGMSSAMGANLRMDNNYFLRCSTPVRTDLQTEDGFVMGMATNFYDNCGPSVITTTENVWVPPYAFTAAPAETVPELVMMKAGPEGRKVQYTTPYTLEAMPNEDKINMHVSFTYGDGPVKNDVFGNPHPEGQILGNVVASSKLSFRANYNLGYGPTATDPASSVDVLALPNQRLSSAGDVFTFETGTTLLKQAFVVPPDKVLVSVVDLGDGTSYTDITKEYLLIFDDFVVKNALGWSNAGYHLHIRTQGITYYASHTHQITFKNKE